MCVCVCVCVCEFLSVCVYVIFFYEILCFRAFMSSVRFRCRYQCILVLLCNIVVHGQLLRGSL